MIIISQINSIVAESTAPAAKRLLLICYEYGPHNHTGAFRWKSFCKHLSHLGWDIEVIAADLGQGDQPNLSGAKTHAVSPNYFIYDWRKRQEKRYLDSVDTDQDFTEPKTAASELKIRKVGQRLSLKEHLLGLVSGALDLVDAWVWTSRAKRKVLESCKPNKFDVVVGTSPLHQTQLVAAYASSKFNFPYIADYRDPWYFGRGPERVRLDLASRFYWKRQELRALAHASAAVDIARGVWQGSSNELAMEEGQQATVPRYLIPSGYEQDEVGAAPVDSSKFRIAYIGWLWPFMPLPSLFAAVSAVCQMRPEVQQQLVLELIGVDRRIAGVSLRSLMKSHGIEAQVEISQRVSQDKAKEKMEAAAVLVAFDSVCAHPICVPSKIYHYARCRGDILAIGGPQGSMAAELQKIQVPTIAPDHDERIVERLLESHSRWSKDGMNEINDSESRLSVNHRVEEMNELLRVVAFGTAESDRLKRLRIQSHR